MTTTNIATQIDPLKLKLELIYGRSGSGKTSWILKLARYLFLKTGKRTRWLIADGGGETITTTGWTGPDGFIDLWMFSNRNNPIETSQLICEGYTPADPLNPNTKMLPPTQRILDDTALWVFEGLTYMSDYIMGEKIGGLANRMARGERLNNDDSFRLKDGDLVFGGNARTHYGFTQRKILDLISRTASLPGIKYWTAHEVKVEDVDYRESLFGPDVCGQKLTARIGASFGNTIHMHVAHIESKTKDALTGKEVKVIEANHRAYLQVHYDPDAQTTAKYFANTRVDARVRVAFPSLVPEFLFPADPIAFYTLIDQARSREAELDKAVQELPDLKSLISPLSADVTRRIDLS